MGPGFDFIKLFFAIMTTTNTKLGKHYRIIVQNLMVGLHYGDYRSRLVPFEPQKNIFYN